MPNPEPTWSRFLHVRRDLINEWRTEGKTCTEIAQLLSMDAGQVFLISTVEPADVVPEDARRSIIEVRDRGLAALKARQT
jgi:hypothetical protein